MIVTQLLFLYIVLYLLSVVCMSKTDRLMYIYSIKHIDFFVWQYSKSKHIKANYYLLVGIILLLFFPILSLIPNSDIFFRCKGIISPTIVSLIHDKEMPRNLASKMFWYHCFTQHKINTPKVYFHVVGKEIIKLNEPDSVYCIIKPNYGAEGKNVEKIRVDEIPAYAYHNMVAQEYVKDCYQEHARYFRINTMSHKSVFILSIDELTQLDKTNIVSNHASGSQSKYCSKYCDHLSYSEQSDLFAISEKLLALHEQEFVKVPLLGWDVCLTDKGPYVFEGNLGGEISEIGDYPKFTKMMDEIYAEL